MKINAIPLPPKEIVLTQHQQEALDKILTWQLIPNSPFYRLVGSAGVGKTTVLNQFIKQNKISRNSIFVSAPTHKAKKVIETVTGLQGYTIQAILGLRPNTDIDNFDINRPQFDPLGEAMIRFCRILIIDEASMLNKDLYEMICSEAKHNGTKVLFVGDNKQLPPIKEIASLAITAPDGVELKEIIRQAKDNPILDILSTLRDDIENNTNNYKLKLLEGTKINEKGEGIILLDKSEFTALATEYFNSPEFNNNIDYCRFVAWTNDCVTAWNKFIRGTKFKEDGISPNDIITGYKTITDEYGNSTIINSEDYLINSASLITTEEGIKVYLVKAVSEGYGEIIFNLVHPEGLTKFLEIERKLHIDALAKKGRYWKEYYKFKNRYLLKSNIIHKERLLVQKDIDYAYCITVHKTQGSTFENVFVNLPNIEKNRNSIDKKKLIYVALSRASKKVIILKPE